MWVLEQLLEANDRISPSVIISDADTGLDAALKTFLPSVKHVHCIFHIRQNLDRHIQRSLGENYNSFLLILLASTTVANTGKPFLVFKEASKLLR